MNEIQKIKSLSDELLITQTKGLVAEERSLAALVLKYLAEIKARRLYCELGYSSLFMFCVKHLGYTESQTQRRIEATRALEEIPEIEDKIKEGKLSLTAVAQAQSYFRSQKEKISVQDKKEILKTLENKSTRECEKTLIAMAPDITLPKEKIRPITSTHTQVTLNLPNDLMEKLNQIKNLLSHKDPNMSQAELIDEMAEIALNKLDPLRKAQRQKTDGPKADNSKQKTNADIQANPIGTESISHELQRTVSTAPQVNSQVSSINIPSSKYIPLRIRRQVWSQSQGQCSFVGQNGQRCESKTLLEIDHKIPKALGGDNNPENLRLLCRAHNQWAAIQAFGAATMSTWL